MEEGRILAIDYGEVRMGLAISDPLRIFAFPLTVIDLKKNVDFIKTIQDIIKEKEVKRIIIGYPLKMDGSEGIQTEKVKGFVEELKGKINIDIEMVDERLTTTVAQRALTDIGIGQKKQRGIIDKIAAAKLLETYLELNKGK
ncbi:MAG TPA: Holliday junction resolvase RuvX [Candidatus Hydrogenedens sp.]|nr:Holliday junction resolvase RuvX [Candidatus Hydrogenedens sp.]